MRHAGRWALPRHLDQLVAGGARAWEALPWRPTLLTLTAGAATVAAITNGMAVGSAAEPAPTRMGVSIQQSMGERDQAIARQKRGLELREQAMRAAEQRLKTDLEARQGEGPDSPARADPRQEPEMSQPFDDLARIYQTMKPARAAPIFERLELDVQVQIARRMRERSTALMMSSMSPNAAVQLSMALAGRRVAPLPAAAASASRTPANGPRPSSRKPLPAGKAIASAEPMDGKAPMPATASAGRRTP
jgi:flagellar motility protein MotE (MotC chaperone)